ncbi:carbohydrate ABC transporter permease [Spirochaeta dissipatitropha]
MKNSTQTSRWQVLDHMPIVILMSSLILLACIWLFPVAMAILNSFKTRAELFTNVLSLPAQPSFANYVRSFQRMNYVRSLFNTSYMALGGAFGIIFCSSLAGWALARIKTKLSIVLFSFFVFSMLIPFHGIMIPLYQVARMLRISNSLWGMMFIYSGLGVGMAIFMYHGFVKSIPRDLEDAAMIDGCSQFGIFIRVVFPLLKPITATVFIMNVLWMWNDFLLPLIMLRDSRNYTLLLSTNMLFGQYASEWPAILSALILAVIPVLILYALLQKQIVKGIINGALKG